MLLVLTAFAFLFLGRELALRLWRDELPGRYELTTYATAIGICLWLASLWAIALLQAMYEPVLVARTLVALGMGLWLALTRRVAPPSTALRERALVVALVALWVLFILWRGWLLPPVTHDALAYHLPKAVLWARAGGYRWLSFLDVHIRNLPSNYEMLLSETIVLQHRDTITEWISTLFYVLFAISCAAIAERWWKRNAATVVLFAAGIPVALLHSGAHKNDLMTAFFIVAGLIAAGRFIAIRDRRALFLCVIVFATAVGTKPQAGAIALCLAPALVWRSKPKMLIDAAIIGVVAFILLGGAVYISNAMNSHTLIGVQSSVQRDTVIAYGDWRNLWQGPYVLIAAPFATKAFGLNVPWESRPWFWRRYEIFFSHLGLPFAICAIALPIAMFVLRRRATIEAWLITAACIVGFAIMLPVNFPPHGMYDISLPRYSLFIVPIVFGWTIAAIDGTVAHRVLIAIGAIAFVAYAIDMAAHDAFAPWAFVRFVQQHPKTRQVPFDPYRAAEVVDRRAGPHDRIALDAAFGTWIHPAFGAELDRPIDFILPGDGPPQIRSDAQWVVIDRSWHIFWDRPEFKDLSQARMFLLRGKPLPEDTRVLRYLYADRRFRLLFYNPTWNQAVFQRIR